MSTLETPLAIEFRCNQCWQTNYAPVELACSNTDCSSCGANVLVPEATEQRVKPLESVTEPLQNDSDLPGETLSDAQMVQMVRQENYVTDGEMDYSGHANASALTRLLAAFIDSTALVVSVIFGFFALVACQNIGLVDLPEEPQSLVDLLPLTVLYFFPLLLLIGQWNLIATRGQTIGKFVTMIRIVNVNGRLPGFLMGVVVRNWVRNLFGLIPLFSLFDIVMIFSDSKRCIHDYMAGTRVIQN